MMRFAAVAIVALTIAATNVAAGQAPRGVGKLAAKVSLAGARGANLNRAKLSTPVPADRRKRRIRSGTFRHDGGVRSSSRSIATGRRLGADRFYNFVKNAASDDDTRFFRVLEGFMAADRRMATIRASRASGAAPTGRDEAE
jgi:hypothetical protein